MEGENYFKALRQRQPEGGYFLDRDPLTFATILRWLQGYPIPLEERSHAELLLLRDDATFYALSELEKAVDVALELKRLKAEEEDAKSKTIRQLTNELEHAELRRQATEYAAELRRRSRSRSPPGRPNFANCGKSASRGSSKGSSCCRVDKRPNRC